MQWVFFYEFFHQFLGSVLYKNSKIDFTRYNITDITDIQMASTFPDRVKYTKRYFFTRSWHYLDIPSAYCGNETLVDSYLFNATNSGLYSGLYKGLFKGINPPANNSFAFKLHFLQDLVQPFHTIGYFSGGNGIYGRVDGKNTSLHVLWDSVLPKLYVFEPLNLNTTRNGSTLNAVTNQLKKSFNRACIFKLENNFVLNSQEYFKNNNLQNLFQTLVQEYFELAELFFE